MNSNNLQQILLAKEVTPPADVWEKVAVALDEQKADDPFRNEILSSQVSPPDEAWKEINQRLKDEIIAGKLLKKQVSAPADMWARISEQLDAETDVNISEQLRAATVTPPAAVWNKVETILNEQQQPAKVIPFKTGFRKVMQYAAAAAITGILAWGSYKLLTKQPAENESLVIAEKPSDNKEELKVTEPIVSTPETTATTNSSAPASPVRNEIKKQLKKEHALAKADLQIHSSDKIVAAHPHHKNNLKAPTGFSENEYLMLINDNGDLVRVTKRINKLKCMQQEDTPVDATAALNTSDCDNEIKSWQKKMAMSASLASSSGIIDLAEVIKTEGLH